MLWNSLAVQYLGHPLQGHGFKSWSETKIRATQHSQKKLQIECHNLFDLAEKLFSYK